MTNIFSLIESRNHEKLTLFLDKESEEERVQGFLNQKFTSMLDVDTFGNVTCLNPIQYVIAALLTEASDKNKAALYEILWILIKKSEIRILNHVDSEENSCLHYCALLSDTKIVEHMINKNVKVLANKKNEKAFVYAKNITIRRMLETYCNTNCDPKQQFENNKSHNIVFEKDMKTKKCDDNENCDSNTSSYSTKNSIMKLKPYKHLDIKENAVKVNDSASNNDTKDTKTEKIRTIVNDFNHTINDFEIEKIYVKKYPGKLYISVNTIIGFFSEQIGINAVAVQVCVNTQEQTTNLHSIGTHIDIDETFIFNVEEAPAKIKVYMIVEYANRITKLFGNVKATKKVLKSKITLTEQTIDKYHNKLVTHEFHWEKYNTPSFFYVLKEVFGKKDPNASVLHTFISFVSDDELQHINAPAPHNLHTLSNWIKYRQNSFITWYKGYVAIRGDKSPIATFLWKRRYIQWHGYNIMIFNATSGTMIGLIDISQASYVEIDENSKMYGLKNTIRLKIENSLLEMQFDNKEKYNTAMLALKTVLCS